MLIHFAAKYCGIATVEKLSISCLGYVFNSYHSTMAEIKLVRVPGHKPIRILEWLVKKGEWIKHGTPLAVYRVVEEPTEEVKPKEVQLKSKHVGTVKMFLMHEGQVAIPDGNLMEIEECCHPVVMKDMCAECGQDLKGRKKQKSASVSMIPNIPELRISAEQAEEIAQQDKNRLHKMRKLVLLVDLDQTLIHTTQDPGLAALCQSTEDFYSFQLSKNDPTLFTKLRPHCREFLKTVAQCYELQIVTFGSRQYAHKIADFIDKEKKYFAHRILSRDECIHPFKKSGNLRHLFPCGDSMVCIIDDRDDVWNAVPNLIVVKKYSYFQGIGDINNPYKQTASNGKQKGNSDSEKTEKQPNKKRKSETDDVTENEMSNAKRPRTAGAEGDSIDETEPLKTDDDLEKSKKQMLDSNENNIITDMEEEKEINVGDDLGLSSDSESSSSTASSSSDSSNSSSDADSKVRTQIENQSQEEDATTDDKNKTMTESNGQSISTANGEGPVNETKESDSVNVETESSTGDTCPELSQQSAVTDTNINSQERLEQELTGFSAASQDYASPSDISSQESGDNSRHKFTDADDYLKFLQDILLQIHSTYYEAYEKFLKKEFKDLPDVRGVVPFLRSKVLYGCVMVLSGIIPQNTPVPPHHHKAYIIARQLGAQIEEQVSDRTTHLIASKKGTAKYQDVKRQKRRIFTVGVEWLWCCSERWERVSEKLFPVPDKSVFEKSEKNKNASQKQTPTPDAQHEAKMKPANTYNPVTGKLIKRVQDPRFNFMVAEAERRRKEGRKERQNCPVPLYSSLKLPDAVIPIMPEPTAQSSSARHAPLTKSNTSPASYKVQVRSRKRSMAEMVPVGYSLSTEDIADMDKEVDDLLESSDEEEADEDAGDKEGSSDVKQPEGDAKGKESPELGTLIEIPEESVDSQALSLEERESSDAQSEKDGKESSDESDEMDEWLKKEMPDFYGSDEESMDVPQDGDESGAS